LAVKSFLIETRFAQPQAGETGRWAVRRKGEKSKRSQAEDFMFLIAACESKRRVLRPVPGF
jgi:hypothetical protein